MAAENVIELHDPVGGAAVPGPCRVRLVGVRPDGLLQVRSSTGPDFLCEWLESSANRQVILSVGDDLLAIPPDDGAHGVALGRIGRYVAPTPEARVTLEATEVLTLKCGSASVDLRADGKLMIQGQDVLLKAKGTQRIKAGSVAIN